jgi:hypothetical protein
VRQRGLVFLNPRPVARVDNSAAERTPEIMLGVGQGESGDLSSDHGAARSRLVEWHGRRQHLPPSFIMRHSASLRRIFDI